MHHRRWLLVLFILMIPVTLQAQEAIPLWPPGSSELVGTAAEDVPQLTVYLPPADLATGTAIVICPGGGYRNLAMDHEGA